MNFDPNDISITPNDWFRPNVVYEGRGRIYSKEQGSKISVSMICVTRLHRGT